MTGVGDYARLETTRTPCREPATIVRRENPGELATLPCFSRTTLSATECGDFVPVDPFARLVTLESEDRRR